MVRMVGKLVCICLRLVNRRKENTRKEKEGDAEQASSVFGISKPGETEAAIPVSLIDGGHQHGQGCSCSSPECCVGAEQTPGLSAMRAPRTVGLQHRGLGLLREQGR